MLGLIKGINIEDGGIYFYNQYNLVGKVVDLSQGEIGSRVNLSTLISEIKNRSWLVDRERFIDQDGNLRLYQPSSAGMTDVVDGKKILSNLTGKIIRRYSGMTGIYSIDIDTSLICVDLLNGNTTVSLVNSADHLSSADLGEVAKKLIIPGLKCTLSRLVVGYVSNNMANAERESSDLRVDDGSGNTNTPPMGERVLFNIGESGLEFPKESYEYLDSSNGSWYVETGDEKLKLFATSPNILDYWIDRLEVSYTINNI